MNKDVSFEHEHLLSILESFDGLIYVSDPETYEVLFSNKALKDEFGDVVGRKCYKAFQNNDLPCDFCTNKHILGHNLGRSYIWEFRNKKNNRWYRCIDKAIQWPDGRLVRFEIAIDITENKSVLEKLTESEERYKDLVEKSGVAILIDDKEGNFIYANERFAELFGYAVEEMNRQSIRTIVHPDDLEMAMRYHLERLKGKKVPSRYEFKGIKKDGSILYLEVNAVALKKGKDILGTRSYMWDITDRKKSEEAVRESERRFRSVVEYSHDGIVIVDDKFKVTYCNDELGQILGYVHEDIIGQDFRKFIGDESKEVVVDRYLRRQQGEKVPHRYEFSIVRKNGEKRRVEISSAVIRNTTGKVKTVGQILDITERKRTEDDLKNTLNMLRKAMGASIQALNRLVEMRDPYTAGHQRRVSDLARALAIEIGLSREQIDGIRMAGQIHDIGKISVPAEILTKPGRLNDMEFGIIKSHVQSGFDILKTIEFPWPIAQIVLQHHERIDGSGYPQGLLGEKILVEAKILGVADVVEAMVSHRPYRSALGIDRALEEISKNKGILYDQEVVDACLRLFHEKGYRLKE
jgi:PAS domain S-box-containing protein